MYRGIAIPQTRGRYIFGDFCSGAIWVIDPSDPTDIVTPLEMGPPTASFVEPDAGELLVVDYFGPVYRLEPG